MLHPRGASAGLEVLERPAKWLVPRCSNRPRRMNFFRQFWRMVCFGGGHKAGGQMAFKPNYRRDRAERQRAARARTEEKQRKKEEKAVLRKAEREATEAPPDEKQTIR
jgi:hypothetical protein